MVHEASLCSANLRQQRCLSQKGFELANGLPFVASDAAIHDLCAARSIPEALNLQRTLGKLRRASGHFKGQLLIIDPHRLPSFSKRQMTRHKDNDAQPACKVSQTFFCLDADTAQPICFTTGSSSRSVAQATPELLQLAADILNPQALRPLVLADTEHWSVELFQHVREHTLFDLLVPMPNQPAYRQAWCAIPASAFTSPWVGWATTKQPFYFEHLPDLPLIQFVQRAGESASALVFKAFLGTADRNEIQALSLDYPKRWHIEEFFHTTQDLGWKRAGTLNLNIRYAQMTMALIAQAALYQLRQRLGFPWLNYESRPFAQKLLRGLDGDIRVNHDTILVTFYNAPNAERWRQHFEHLPDRLASENISPHIPWLYNFKLDFRFR
jgi:hypothetical protein